MLIAGKRTVEICRDHDVSASFEAHLYFSPMAPSVEPGVFHQALGPPAPNSFLLPVNLALLAMFLEGLTNSLHLRLLQHVQPSERTSEAQESSPDMPTAPTQPTRQLEHFSLVPPSGELSLCHAPPPVERTLTLYPSSAVSSRSASSPSPACGELLRRRFGMFCHVKA